MSRPRKRRLAETPAADRAAGALLFAAEDAVRANPALRHLHAAMMRLGPGHACSEYAKEASNIERREKRSGPSKMARMARAVALAGRVEEFVRSGTPFNDTAGGQGAYALAEAAARAGAGQAKRAHDAHRQLFEQVAVVHSPASQRYARQHSRRARVSTAKNRT